MKMYQGTKVVQAEPMTMEEAYNQHLLQAGKTPRKGQDGYKVIYQDGYTSWSPKEVFERAYEPCDTFLERMNIEQIDLTDKLLGLHKFQRSDKYKQLTLTQRALLDIQERMMAYYHSTLNLRYDNESTQDIDDGIRGITFGMAIDLLNFGYIVRRKGWNNKKLVVFKQTPACIYMDVVPKMQSLHDSAKELIAGTEQVIRYESQCLIYDYSTGCADSWTPNIADVFAWDWELVEPEKIKKEYTPQTCALNPHRQ